MGSMSENVLLPNSVCFAVAKNWVTLTNVAKDVLSSHSGMCRWPLCLWSSLFTSGLYVEFTRC